MKTNNNHLINLNIPNACEECFHSNYCLAPTASGCSCFELACDAE